MSSVGPGHAITSKLERSAVSTATSTKLVVVADGGGHTYLEDADSETRFNGVGGLHTASPALCGACCGPESLPVLRHGMQTLLDG